MYVDMIAFMRVTHSRRIFVQQLGRGLRISPSDDQLLTLGSGASADDWKFAR